MPTPDPHLDQLLRTAIEQTRLLRLRYRNKDRIVEPHDYGEHNGVIKLLTYQVGGSSSGPLPNWRWMETDLISDARTARPDLPRRPPDGLRQTSQMGQAVPQGQTGRQRAEVAAPPQIRTLAERTRFCPRRTHGPVYSPQRSLVEPLASEFRKISAQGFLSHVAPPKPEHMAMAKAMGRDWLGESHAAMRALEIAVGTHHGALRRPFLNAVEELLNDLRLKRSVVASPTLAQGIDLACSVLIFPITATE